MPSLQLLQLTERGRGLVASRRKAILLAAGIAAAGGTAVYLKSRISSRRHDSSRHCNGHSDDDEASGKLIGNDKNAKKSTKKKKGGGLKSLQVLTAILLYQMEKMGARDLLALVGTVVFRTALSNRLGKVQGFLFRAAFLRRAPLFLRLISENIVLCFMLSTTHATSNLYRTIWRRLLMEFYMHGACVHMLVQNTSSGYWPIRNFSPFGKLMSTEQQLEGEYRQLQPRLRTHSESIAFYGWGNREDQQKFKNLVSHMSVVLHEHLWFGMIQDFLLKYLGATVAVILIIKPFFSGYLRPDDSTLGRAEMLSNIRYHTSVIISLFQALGRLSISSRRLNRLSGYADRIHELMAVSRELSSDDKSIFPEKWEPKLPK